MKNRNKVILYRRDSWGGYHQLALTDEQINLLNWLVNQDLIDNDIWNVQILENADIWVEV